MNKITDFLQQINDNPEDLFLREVFGDYLEEHNCDRQDACGHPLISISLKRYGRRNGNGSGNGNAYGCGNGSGSGSRYGSGNGNGKGIGLGYGNGNGKGSEIGIG